MSEEMNKELTNSTETAQDQNTYAAPQYAESGSNNDNNGTYDQAQNIPEYQTNVAASQNQQYNNYYKNDYTNYQAYNGYSNYPSNQQGYTAPDQQYQQYQYYQQQPSQNNYNTGYYSSQNQYSQAGSYSYPTTTDQNYYQPTPSKKKKEKKKSGGGVVFACILLALIFGLLGSMGGMYIYDKYLAPNSIPTGGGTTIVYNSASHDLTQSVTDAGTIAQVAATALPSVVEITTEAVVNNNYYGQYVTQGAGSGVIISSDGYIVTNNHVVSGASNIKVRLSNGDEHQATLIGTDAQTDIAVIKINASGLKSAIYGNSETLVVGELTVAIGNPLGELGGTVTDGIISALGREITIDGENMVLLQTNAAVNPGNSGGGLFNAKAELIGIVNAKSSGDSVEGLGFAIPINTAKTIIEDIIKNGHVTGRPSLGVSVIEVTTDYQKYMYRVSEFGVYIQSSVNGEFKAWDRIIAVDGNSISVSSDVKAIINSHAVGDKVTVTVSRNGKILDVEVTLIDSYENTKK